MSGKAEKEPYIPWFVERIHAFAMQGMTKSEVVAASGFSRHAVWSALKGWAMNEGARAKRRKGHATGTRTDRTSKRRRAKAEETRGV